MHEYKPDNHAICHIVIKYTSCDRVVFDDIPFPSSTHKTGMTHFLALNHIHLTYESKVFAAALKCTAGRIRPASLSFVSPDL